MPSISKDIALEKNKDPPHPLPQGLVKNAKSSGEEDKGLHPQQLLFKSEKWGGGGKNNFTQY